MHIPQGKHDISRILCAEILQSKLASKTDRRKFYTSVLRSHAGWKTKDFKGMTFEQIEETFIPVWESIQDFVPMDSKLESERFKRPGTLLEKERAKRLKTVEGSEQQSEGNKDVKEKDSDDHDKIINLQQWVVLVRQESSVDITPSVVKAPIYDWKIFKDKLREVYQIFRVGQAPKAYPYFEAMLKEFDRDDMVTLWKLVKDRFKEELPKSDLEKCLFWPLKVMFEPVATDGLWQFEAPIKSWRLYKSCRVHCLIMEGMIIYMLDDVEYPLPKTTLQKMLDHKCEDEVSNFKKVIEKWTSGKVSLDQLLSEQIPGNIVHALGGNLKIKDKQSTKDIVFVKAEESPVRNEIEYDSDNESKESLSKSVKKKTQTKSSSVSDKKLEKKVETASKELLLILICEIYGSTTHETSDHGLLKEICPKVVLEITLHLTQRDKAQGTAMELPS
ncbi:hypothetical protein Tco_1314866 [Tanacetum coccineum]